MSVIGALLPAVRPRERPRFAFFLALGAGFALAQTVGLAAVESLFLARVGAERLPLTYVVASLSTMVAGLVYARRLGRARNDVVWIELLVVATLLCIGGGAAAWWRLAGSAEALLCVQMAVQSIVGNHYGELAGDVFDRLSSKRIGPALGVGASLGAAAGGGVALALAPRVPVEALVALWAVLLALLALGIRVGRGRLQRWAPLGDEEDASSLPGVRAAARYVAAAPLGRWLLLSGVAMVSATLVARFLWSEVLADRFEAERALTAFLALWLTLSHVAEIALPIWIAPWLVQRFGVPSANLLHPALTLVTSLGLALSPQLPVALAARANGELVENAFAGPVRGLMGEALPVRFQARVSAFLSGVVANAAMAIAGAALLFAGGEARVALAVIAAGFAAIYLLGHVGLRRQYLRAIVAELRAGRLDLKSVRGELGQQEIEALAALFSRWLREEGERALRPLAELAGLLAARGELAPLTEGVAHSSARLRAACLEALGACGPESEATRVALCAGALTDPDARVRRAAIAALPGATSGAAPPAELGAALAGRLHDVDPVVRARAALRCGDAGATVLRAMAASERGDEAIAALDVLPGEHAASAAPRLRDPEPRVRAAALRCAARHPEALAGDAASVVEAASDPHTGVRRAAIAAIAASRVHDAAGLLSRALADGASEVRAAAARGLAERGALGRLAVARWLEDDAPLTATEAALDVVGASADPDARSALVAKLRALARDAWSAALALRVLPEDGAVPVRFLRAAQLDAGLRAVRLVFRVLAKLEDESVVRTVERTLRFGPERLRLDALDVLSHLGDRVAAGQLVLLFEPTPLEDKLRQLPGGLPRPRGLDEVREATLRSGTRWQRFAARAAVDPQEESRMERLVFLRQVPLFTNLTLDQLEAVERITREEELVEGEEIVREGDPGDELYLLVEGEVAVWKGLHGDAPVRLNVLGPGSYVGEMSILDREGRSASVVTTQRSRCLVLEGMRLRELVLDEPEIAFEMFRVLTARLRAAEARLGAATPPT